MPVASEGLSSMKRRFVSRLPAVHPETKITNLAALNVNEMKDDMLESIDVSSLVNLKGSEDECGGPSQSGTQH